MGMSSDDFERCTPTEFSEACNKWQQHQEMEMRRSWEQTRFLALVSLQPFSKKPIHPEDIVTFNWDKENETQPKVTEKSTRKRMERMKERMSRFTGITETSVKTNGTPDNGDGAQ